MTASRKFFILIATFLLFGPQPSSPQQAASGSSPSGGTFAGSVTQSQVTSATLALTLREAISMGIQANLGAIEFKEEAQLSRAQRLLALSALLPSVSASLSETSRQSNLKTVGINIPHVGPIVGPYAYSDVRGYATATAFSWQYIQRYRASLHAESASTLGYQDALELVTLTVGTAYLSVVTSASRVESAKAQVENAAALFRQASDALSAGSGARIDVTRTEVQLETEKYNLSVAQNGLDVARLTLARAIGLPLGQSFEVTDRLIYTEIETSSLEKAIEAALAKRGDYLSALRSAQAAENLLSAARAERYPTLSLSADYGDTGPQFSRSHGTFDAQASLSVPLFTGNRIKSDVVNAQATLAQRKAEAANLRGQVELDVRTSYLNLGAAREQVAVSEKNVGLAKESLEHSKARFESGVTDSVEVVQAEQALAAANDQLIDSAYVYNLSKLTLARSLGVAYSSWSNYVGESHP